MPPPATCSSPTCSGCARRAWIRSARSGGGSSSSTTRKPQAADARERRDHAGLQHVRDDLRRRRADQLLLASFTLEPGDANLTGTPGAAASSSIRSARSRTATSSSANRGHRRAANPVVDIWTVQVHLPESVEEAEALLDQGTLIAGGTHVMSRGDPTGSLVSLRRAGLSGVETDGDTVRLGATTTLTQLTARCRSCARRSSRSRPPRSATWPRSAATCSCLRRTATSRSACSRSARGSRRPTAASSPTCPSRSPSAGSTPRRCAASRTAPRSSPWRAMACGSAPRRRAEPRALAAEARLAEGDIDGAAEAALEVRRPVRRRVRQRGYRRRVLPVDVRRALKAES